jgi:tetratricopeptide (TPR) repeat protein
MGVLLYFLVTGEYPVWLRGLSASEALERLARRRPLMDLRPDVPESLLRTVSTAMNLDPAKRYASAGELATALAESLGVSPPAETISISIPQDLGARNRVRNLAIVAVAAALVAGFFAWPGRVLRVSHLFGKPAPTSGANTYDQYQKAQDLLLHSYKNSNIADAVKGFQAVLQADPTFALAEARLGTAYFLQYRNSHDFKLLDMAKDATDRAIDLDPNLAPPYITLSRMAAMQAQTPLAMQLAHKALDLDPRSPEAYGALADVYEAEGKSSDAVASLQKAIDLAPDDWRWPVRLGNDEFRSGNPKDAIVQFQRGVDLAPDNAVAYFDLGIVNMRSGRLEEARKDLETSVKIEPDADTYSALGTVLLLDGKYDDAAAMNLKSIQLNPNDYVAWSGLGDAYQWSGNRHAEAVKAFRKAIELEEAARAKNSQDPQLLALLANHYASTGNTAQSLILIRQALAIAPLDPEVRYQVGDAYEALGRRADAIPLIAKALAEGYADYEFQRNPGLASLRADPAFKAALSKESEKKK